MRAAFQAFREAITPTLKVSEFMEGRLTPEEFVQSGEALVRAYPSFSWLYVAPENIKGHLPATKQCLVMRDIASRARVADIKKGADETIMSDEGDWTAAGSATAPANASDINKAAADDYDDIDNYYDPSVIATVSADIGLASNVDTRVSLNNSLRLYDLYIVYDIYYACPRAYLVGRQHTGELLGPDQMMEDIMQDYVDKTATLERFPFQPDMMTVSIHPCRHTQTMKRILGGMCVGTGATATLTVESYMPAFLKMLASMLPTLEYDYTAAVCL